MESNPKGNNNSATKVLSMENLEEKSSRLKKRGSNKKSQFSSFHSYYLG